MNKECDCVDICQRWGVNEDGNGAFFCPYVPEGLGMEVTNCKHLEHRNMKPHIIDRSTND